MAVTVARMESLRARLAAWASKPSHGYPPPASPQPPVTLQVRQGAEGAQVVTLWVTREVADREGLALTGVPHRPERPMFLDVDTDVMGAAVVPLRSFDVRLLDEG